MSSFFKYNGCIDVSQEVSKALRNHSPVVALESTIISHGMPYPQNLQTALQVEEVIRNQVKCYRLTGFNDEL
jgi:pseudouridine-5'-phosphate glycosidase